MDCMYKGWGWWWGQVGSQRQVIPSSRTVWSTYMSPRTTSHRLRPAWRALKDALLTQGSISDPYFPSSALHGLYCPSCDFTWSAKPAPEKQTSQLSPSIQQYMGSVWVWLLAGSIKCNWPSLILWSVFANPVTYVTEFVKRGLMHASSFSTIRLRM